MAIDATLFRHTAYRSEECAFSRTVERNSVKTYGKWTVPMNGTNAVEERKVSRLSDCTHLIAC